ncbi:hypothetical protein ES703_88690 [subsurface metagenome]
MGRGSEGFGEADQELRKAIDEMEHSRDRELNQKRMNAECVSVLKSLKNHWEVLKVFIDHPHIPMDNSKRPPAKQVVVSKPKGF